MDISNINPFTKIDLPTLAEVDRMNKPQLEKTMADMVHLVVTCDPLFAALSESVRTSQNNRSVIDMAYFLAHASFIASATCQALRAILEIECVQVDQGEFDRNSLGHYARIYQELIEIDRPVLAGDVVDSAMAEFNEQAELFAMLGEEMDVAAQLHGTRNSALIVVDDSTFWS
ncbi:MAG: hypothetical protein ACD_65C00005G0002 [uncultured bacterium]|nr:MAG: hypothetical protein ACD_65C00005G0002 [uncultured bacterium]